MANKVDGAESETLSRPSDLCKQTGQFAVDPLTMSVGSNLLAMLNNRASIQTTTTEPKDKSSNRASQQMRRCMKNFNFKLDYSEIDRIIEEQDDETGFNPPAEETKQ